MHQAYDNSALLPTSTSSSLYVPATGTDSVSVLHASILTGCKGRFKVTTQHRNLTLVTETTIKKQEPSPYRHASRHLLSSHTCPRKTLTDHQWHRHVNSSEAKKC
jgi:hypothetical protein